ncbi:MAG: hypothetical protein GDA56_32940 [Hormoscilla sp. GM7CHS1pb]|nr:hypothetical protein [Hormoscilla sp. GM7CHS1pb]
MLIGLERCVSVVTIALGAATVTVYGLTVSSGQQWSRDYNSLQSLQRYERQLRVANEVLKNQMAEQAENPDTGLVPQNPTNTIFIPQHQSAFHPQSVQFLLLRLANSLCLWDTKMKMVVRFV